MNELALILDFGGQYKELISGLYFMQKTIAEKLGITARGVRKNIETLKNLEILDRVGAKKKGSWIVKMSSS